MKEQLNALGMLVALSLGFGFMIVVCMYCAYTAQKLFPTHKENCILPRNDAQMLNGYNK